MTGTNEKRCCKRYVVEGLFGSMLSTENVSVVNISIDGVQVKTDKRLIPGRQYNLRIRSGDRSIMVRGEVAWCLLGASEHLGNGQQVPLYSAGMRFTETQNELGLKLLDFIDHSRLHKVEKRLAGVRFRLANEHEAEITSRCTIRQLSRNGMLIETGEPFEVESRIHVDLEFEHGFAKARCRVAYCNEEEDTESVLVGLEFQEFSEEGARRILDHFIEELEND